MPGFFGDAVSDPKRFDEDSSSRSRFSGRSGRDPLDEPVRGSLRGSGTAPVDPLDEPVRGRLQGAEGRRRPTPKPQVEETLEERFYDRLKYVILVVLGVGVLSVLGILVYRGLTSEEEGEGDLSERLQGYLVPEKFGQAYLDANGGVDFLRSIRTIRATGTLETPGKRQEVFLLKRVPDQTLFRLTSGETTVTYGTDGKEYWRSVARDNRIVEVILLEGKERSSLEQSSSFFGDLLGHFLDSTGEIERIEIDEWDGRTMLRIDWIDAKSGEESRFFVDPESMDLLRSVRLLPDGGVAEILYGDYRSLGSFRQPFRTENRVDGEMVSVMTIDSADLNPGILSVSFARPATTAPGRNPFGWSMEEEVRSRRPEEKTDSP